jgi:hypothetical protein
VCEPTASRIVAIARVWIDDERFCALRFSESESTVQRADGIRDPRPVVRLILFHLPFNIPLYSFGLTLTLSVIFGQRLHVPIPVRSV